MPPLEHSPFVWQGRVDVEETGPSTRWHQHVRPFAEDSRGGVALMGFAVDEGVRRNGGRPGAAEGPHMLRKALSGLPVMGEPAVWDAGDVLCTGDQLEAAQDALAQRVAQAIAQGCVPLVLGGGHEVAWGTFQGVVRARPQMQPTMRKSDGLLVVNFDAHFDLRLAAQGNSGTPFRQMHEWCESHGMPFNYRVFGISQFANTQALFDRADALGVRYVLDDVLQSEAGVLQAQAALVHDMAQCDAVYLTIDLDVLPGGVAPGVSAPAALGMPLALVERLVDTVLASGKLVAADIAELNPAFDRDGLTAKVAARLAARMARGCA